MWHGLAGGPWRAVRRMSNGGPVDVADLAVLSLRQREVITLYLTGCSPPAIAEHPGISVRTTEAHLDQSQLRLGFQRRKELPQLC